MLLSDWSNYDTQRIYDAIIAGQNPSSGFYYDYLTNIGAFTSLSGVLNATLIPRETAYYIPDPITNTYKSRIRVELGGNITASGIVYTVPAGFNLKIFTLSAGGATSTAVNAFFSFRVDSAIGAIKIMSNRTLASANAFTAIQPNVFYTPLVWAASESVFINLDAGNFAGSGTGVTYNLTGFLEQI